MQKNIKIGYKVVRKQKNYLYSVNNADIKYKLNIWVYPKTDAGPLVLFNSYKSAINWIKTEIGFFIGLQIYSCEYVQSKNQYIYYCGNTNNKVYIHELPNGTVLATKIKLIKKIDYYSEYDNKKMNIEYICIPKNFGCTDLIMWKKIHK